jgi:pyruvate/2-oxoglutarate dehydrogenase complex dihydrolipoamide acyltransferase (E2) component
LQGGVFGSLMSTPIINPPQAAVLGLHAIFNRCVPIDGKVEIRPVRIPFIFDSANFTDDEHHSHV